MSTEPSKTEKVKEEIKKEINRIPPTTDRNLLAALSYIWVLSLILLVVRRGDEFTLKHARQGLLLNILTGVAFIPVIGWIVSALAIIGMVVGFLNAWQGKEWHAPIVGGWAEWLKSKGL